MQSKVLTFECLERRAKKARRGIQELGIPEGAFVLHLWRLGKIRGDQLIVADAEFDFDGQRLKLSQFRMISRPNGRNEEQVTQGTVLAPDLMYLVRTDGVKMNISSSSQMPVVRPVPLKLRREVCV